MKQRNLRLPVRVSCAADVLIFVLIQHSTSSAAAAAIDYYRHRSIYLDISAVFFSVADDEN